jgi:hypothetical protein
MDGLELPGISLPSDTSHGRKITIEGAGHSQFFGPFFHLASSGTPSVLGSLDFTMNAASELCLPCRPALFGLLHQTLKMMTAKHHQISL